MASSLNNQHKKPNVMASLILEFQSNRKLETIVYVFTIFTALFLFSRSSLFPITLQALSYSRTLFLPLFNDPFYVFLLLNSIILFLYVLSKNNNSTTANNPRNSNNDLYDHIFSDTTMKKNIPQQKQTVTAFDSSSEDKSLIMCSEVVEESPFFKGTVTAVTNTDEATRTCCRTKCYGRVRSESFERRVVAAGSGGAELRRMSSAVAVTGTGTGTGSGGLRRQGRLCGVEQLNKEEFNRAVEDFIAKQKRMLLEEQIQSRKSHNLAF